MRDNPGRYVKTITGRFGKTRNSDPITEGKVMVYITDEHFSETGERILSYPVDLIIIGLFRLNKSSL